MLFQDQGIKGKELNQDTDTCVLIILVLIACIITYNTTSQCSIICNLHNPHGMPIFKIEVLCPFSKQPLSCNEQQVLMICFVTKAPSINSIV